MNSLFWVSEYHVIPKINCSSSSIHLKYSSKEKKTFKIIHDWILDEICQISHVFCWQTWIIIVNFNERFLDKSISNQPVLLIISLNWTNILSLDINNHHQYVIEYHIVQVLSYFRNFFYWRVPYYFTYCFGVSKMRKMQSIYYNKVIVFLGEGVICYIFKTIFSQKVLSRLSFEKWENLQTLMTEKGNWTENNRTSIQALLRSKF